MNAEDSRDAPCPPQLPGYEAKRLLGSGSFGQVWLAQDLCGLFYAVKVIHRDLMDGGETEALELAGLRHYLGVSRENDSLLQVYFIGRGLEAPFLYYVMDLADDANGRDRIRVGQYVPRTLSYDLKSRREPRTVGEVITLGKSLLRGLSYLHENHLIHRDIKPSNIVFNRGVPKLADFGLICLSSKRRRAVRTGSLHYAPERGAGTQSADLYSLAKVLWVCWTGRDVAEFPCIPPELLDGSARNPSRRLNEVILRACSDDPGARYQSWRDLWQELDEMENASVEHIPAPLPPRPRSSFPVPPMPLGVISRHSPFYVRREADQRLSHELANSRQHGGLLRLKGPRQSGKTSLVARTLEEARDAGFQVIMADLRQLNQSDFEGLESFYAAFTRLISMSMNPEDAHYDSGLGSPNQRLTEFMEMHVFARLGGPVLLALDNIERMIRQSYSPEVFGLMRSWFEFRETRQQPWRRFTLLISYADDELSLEERMNHSPFNVGIRIEVGGLTLSGVEQLNQAYDGPLANQDECGQFLRLTGGKPFLVNFGLYDLARRKLSFTDFNVIAAEDDGPYRDELRRVRRLVDNSAPLRDGVGAVLRGKTCPSEQVFFDLQSLGILSGVQRQPRFSCDLYARYFGGRSGQSTTGS